MEKKIIQRLYIKLILAGVAGLILCVTASFLAGMWSTLWLGGFVILAVAFTALSIHYDIKKGNIISVYAECYENVANRSLIKAVANSKTTYRFITKSAESILFDTEDDDSISIYIKGEHGKFRNGELYCILFRKSSEKMYNEQNLLAYGVVEQNIMSFTADDGIGNEVSSYFQFSEDENSECETNSDKKCKIIKFRQKDINESENKK